MRVQSLYSSSVSRIRFPDRKVVNDSYVHDLTKLLNVSRLTKLHREEADQNDAFAKNWGVVQEWSEASRYNATVTETTATGLFLATTDPTNGVLTWLKKYY
jgi:hypothetical protein